MKLNLNKNIQFYRKRNKMTQEQLAEALGVTVGAVSKWENGLSNPDITMIADLAGYFEISVDVLLGYEITKENAGKASEHVNQLYKQRKILEAREEVNKALNKYPNDFQLNFDAATIEKVVGMEYEDKDAYRKSIFYYERALKLFDQNKDEKITKLEIEINIAENYGELKEYEEAIRRLKRDNPMGINDHSIGTMYVHLEKMEEAEPYFSDSIVHGLVLLINSVTMMNNVHIKNQDYEKVILSVQWMKTVLTALMGKDEVNYYNRVMAVNECFQSYAQAMMNQWEDAKESLRCTLRLCEQFEAAENYTISIPFINKNDGVVFDDIKKGSGFIDQMLDDLKAETDVYDRFKQMYESVKEEEYEGKTN